MCLSFGSRFVCSASELEQMASCGKSCYVSGYSSSVAKDFMKHTRLQGERGNHARDDVADLFYPRHTPISTKYHFEVPLGLSKDSLEVYKR